MDSFEWNKIFGGVLGSLLAIMAIKEVAAVAFHHEAQEQLAYAVEVPESTSSASTETAVVEAVDYGALLRDTDPAAGQRVAARCVSCHNFEKGEPNKIGPNLYGIVGREIASVAGFAYSRALQGKDGVWTYEKLDGFLENPRDWAPGTNMNYGGLSRQGDRIRIIAYMRSQSDEPYPLPEPLASDEPAEEEGGDGAASDDGSEQAAAPAGEDGADEAAPAGEDDTGGEADGGDTPEEQ